MCPTKLKDTDKEVRLIKVENEDIIQQTIVIILSKYSHKSKQPKVADLSTERNQQCTQVTLVVKCGHNYICYRSKTIIMSKFISTSIKLILE